MSPHDLAAPTGSAPAAAPTHRAPLDRPRRPRGRLAATVLTATVVLALLSTPAQAHDVLVGTNPADGSTVEVPPHHVTLSFSEPAVALGTEVVVTAPDGTVASTGAPELVDNDVNQYLLEQLPKGTYTVQWRVTSDDGHPVTGSFSFTAQNAIGLPPDATAAPGALEPATPAATEPAATEPAATEPATPTAEPTPVAAPTPDDQAVSPGVLIGIGAALLVVGGVVAWLLLRRPSPDAAPAPSAGPSSGRDPGPDDLP